MVTAGLIAEVSTIFERLLEPNADNPQDPNVRRAMWLVPALAIYCGLVLIPFHEPIEWHSTGEPSTSAQLIAWTLGFVWLVAIAVIVRFGNVWIASIACVGIWWLAQQLFLPEGPVEHSGSLAGAMPTFFGFLNLMLIWAAFSVRAYVRKFGWPQIRKKTAS